ncbi:MAG: hypothetical protein ACREIC_28335, partial [Limisphaerales bacterium]
LKNVGMRDKDLDVLFQSAEHFAQMWERCLVASASFNPLIRFLTVPTVNGIKLTLSWQGTGSDVLQESDNVADPASWRPFSGRLTQANGIFTAEVTIGGTTGQQFYRVTR